LKTKSSRTKKGGGAFYEVLLINQLRIWMSFITKQVPVRIGLHSKISVKIIKHFYYVRFRSPNIPTTGFGFSMLSCAPTFLYFNTSLYLLGSLPFVTSQLYSEFPAFLLQILSRSKILLSIRDPLHPRGIAHAGLPVD